MYKNNLNKLCENQKALVLESSNLSIKSMFNMIEVNQFPIKVIFIKLKNTTYINWNLGDKIFQDSDNISKVVIVNDTSSKKLKDFALFIDDTIIDINDKHDDELEICIYLKNNDFSTFITCGFNQLTGKYQLIRLSKNNADIGEVVLSEKTKAYFPKIYSKLMELRNV